MIELRPRQLDIMQTLAKMLERKGPIKITTSLLAKEGIFIGNTFNAFLSNRLFFIHGCLSYLIILCIFISCSIS